jgi:hypothetical protein
MRLPGQEAQDASRDGHQLLVLVQGSGSRSLRKRNQDSHASAYRLVTWIERGRGFCPGPGSPGGTQTKQVDGGVRERTGSVTTGPVFRAHFSIADGLRAPRPVTAVKPSIAPGPEKRMQPVEHGVESGRAGRVRPDRGLDYVVIARIYAGRSSFSGIRRPGGSNEPVRARAVQAPDGATGCAARCRLGQRRSSLVPHRHQSVNGLLVLALALIG